MVNRNTKAKIFKGTYLGCNSSRHKNLLVLLLLSQHVSGSLGLTICVGLRIIHIQSQLLLLIESGTLFRCSTTCGTLNRVEISAGLDTRSRRLFMGRRKWHLIRVYILDI